MPPKTDAPPRPKKVMTPEMLEKLAAARAKANEARAAMKSDNDELKLQLLQRKMDQINKTKAPKPEKVPEPEPEKLPEPPEPPEPELAPEQPEETDILPEPEPTELKAPPVKATKMKKKKPVVIVENSSDSESSDDNSNVIYIRRKSKGKKPPIDVTPEPQAVAQPPQINPFFSFHSMYHGSHRNFQ